MIRIESDKMSYDILLPTAFSEITKEAIDGITAAVSVPKHYAVVAIVYRERLYSVVSNVKNQKAGQLHCTPILVKLHGDEEEAQGCRLMDRPIIANSALERSNLITIEENILDPIAVGKYCNSDPELTKAILTGAYFNDGETSDFKAKELAPDCYFIDFRMIPVNDIVGGYKRGVKPACEFKVPKTIGVSDDEVSPLLN